MTGMGTLASLTINPMLSCAQIFVTKWVTGTFDENFGDEILFSIIFNMAMVGASAALSKFSPIKVGFNAKKNAGIFNKSAGFLETAKSAKKIARYKANQSNVIKSIIQGTVGYALFTTAQNFTSWGLNNLLGW